MKYIKDKLSIEEDQVRRLRNLEFNQLYYKDEYTKPLTELKFEEGGTRLKIERGEIPVSGNIPIKIKT